jgi:hypothetical protein
MKKSNLTKTLQINNNLKKKYLLYFFICSLILCIIFYLYYDYDYDTQKETMTSEIISTKIFIEPFVGGFFACCAYMLDKIIEYFNNNKKLPESVDSSQQFALYKPSWVSDDITYHFFRKRDDLNIKYIENINYSRDFQFKKYSDINYSILHPFIEKYFSPTQEIIDIENNLIKKYKINVIEYCAVYYRGTDKKEETTIGSFYTYIDKMNELLNKDPNIKFIIQSDSKNFIDTIKLKFNNSISFDENVSSNSDKGIHNENTPNENYIIMKNFLAIICIMSKCKYIICSSGNCSIWMIHFRGNSNNIIQFLNNEWY